MAPNCAVSTCKTVQTKDYAGKKLSYHHFPKDKHLRQIWIRFCDRYDNFNADMARICSLHFNENCYERDFMSEFNLRARPMVRLKPGSVPTIKFEEEVDENHHIEFVYTEPINETINTIKTEDVTNTRKTQVKTEPNGRIRELQDLQKQIDDLKAKNTSLQNKVKIQNGQIGKYKMKIKFLETELRKEKQRNIEL